MGGAEGRRGIFMGEVSGLIPQDYTTYTEKDDFGRLTVSPTSVVSNLLTRNEDAWLVKDFGAGYFDGDSTRELDFVVTGGDNFGIQYPLVLANVIDDVTGLGDHVFLWNAGLRTTFWTVLNLCFQAHSILGRAMPGVELKPFLSNIFSARFVTAERARRLATIRIERHLKASEALNVLRVGLALQDGIDLLQSLGDELIELSQEAA